MIQIIGDEIRFKDWPVARVRSGIPATIRDEFQTFLHEAIAAEELASRIARARDEGYEHAQDRV